MTINQLNKLTSELMAKGAGRRPVCISKDTFWHPLEGDGATIQDVLSASLEVFDIMDDDGGLKTRRDGSTATRMALVIKGIEATA